MRRIYADNGSTSFPKASGVSCVIKDYLDNVGCNINRGGYTSSYDIAMEVLETRQLLADMFHAASPQEVVFTPSATYSINMLLQGFLKKGDHVITTSMEHNAVMRPLHVLSQNGVAYDTAPCSADGSLNVDAIIPLIRKETKAIVMLHASNVCGTVMPIDEVAEVCHRYNIRLIVDAAQTAGVLDINANAIDALVFAGHKGLMGPGGIGGFIIKKDFAGEISPLIVGGTGSLSHGIKQPNFLPDKFESGTINILGILGLKKAVEYINSVGMASIYEKEMDITATFISQVGGISGANIVGKTGIAGRVAVVSLSFPQNDNASIAAALDEDYGIMTRCGLHCAPAAHKTLGTYPHGTVRFSFGCFNTIDEVGYIVQALKEIIKN